ncbi:MAG: hypothetical protein ABS35_18370 [Kaistia sp. SCN 65-12]|nr:MAG: hypothetical protein ABS35_18370 [Kaistia sp. SCN 65-12]
MAFHFHACHEDPRQVAQGLCRFGGSSKLPVKMPKKPSASLGIRVAPAVKTALENAARADMRTTASMAELILVKWLRENGFLT